ncbi:MAG: D-alanyl-D-alanine carboxypeptidase [Corallococcus sp.]|nr:D-alanyl-D-alanine carboxypeptidase [Corallococcus sp.]MCM1359694.1 D-alanyl-D-alanine carboxypeptidase [Corallococcus sp.]MCM1395403.1 D-alanyl-D-alanine carboxypeptidase [Corallococcus sp.]
MKKIILTALCLTLAACLLVPTFACAQAAAPVSVTAKEAYLMSEDGQLIFEKNATEKRPIASMTKLMTLLVVYDAVDNGAASLEDDVFVSANAASMGGSQVFLDANTTHKLGNLVKSVIVCSANDSCVALAEHVSGSVENFVAKMNTKAEELGLVATHFENCTGLPHVSQFSCAKDVAAMLAQVIQHPHYFECANVWMEDYVHPDGRVTGMTNTNRLVRFYEGCDGGKTGYTNEAMHCLAATAKRGDTRIISVVVGATDSKTRFKEVSDMFNYAFANYESKVYLDGATSVDPVAVSGGKQKTVDVTANGKLIAFGKKGEEGNCQVIYKTGEVAAPLKAGDKVGEATLVDANGKEIAKVDLIAKTDVATKSYWDYVLDII